MEKLAKFLESTSSAAHRVAVYTLLPLMVALITVDVALRYLFRTPFSWTQEANGYMLFSLMFLCTSYTWNTKNHIRMDVCYDHMSAPLKKAADILSSLAGTVFFGAMGIQALRDIPYMISAHETGDEVRIMLWPFRAIMAFCCFLLVLQLLVSFFTSAGQTEKGGGH